jgi:hypothetical protein
MRPTRARYVTACQQLLALGVVVVGLAPAAGVVSLDVVGVEPHGGSASSPAVEVRVPAAGEMARVSVPPQLAIRVVGDGRGFGPVD